MVCVVVPVAAMVAVVVIPVSLAVVVVAVVAVLVSEGMKASDFGKVFLTRRCGRE